MKKLWNKFKIHIEKKLNIKILETIVNLSKYLYCYISEDFLVVYKS